MLETMKERKKHIQGLSDSELESYLDTLNECNKESVKENEQIRKEFSRLGLTPHYCIDSNLSTIEMNNFFIATIREEQTKRKEVKVTNSFPEKEKEVFDSCDESELETLIDEQAEVVRSSIIYWTFILASLGWVDDGQRG